MSSRTLVLSPDLIPDDEFVLLNMMRDVQCLVIEQGPEAGYRTTLPGRLTIPGEILIRPGAALEVSGDLKAGHIYGLDRATVYIAGDLSVKSIQVNPGRTDTSLRKADKSPLPGIVVGGYLRCDGPVRSDEGSISARAIRATADIEAGGAIKAVEDIHCANIRAGGEVLAGGVIYVPNGHVNAGGRIVAQLLHGNAFYPAIPVDLAAQIKETDRQVVGNITAGEVVAGQNIPHPRPMLVPRYRIPDEMKAILDSRMRIHPPTLHAEMALST